MDILNMEKDPIGVISDKEKQQHMAAKVSIAGSMILFLISAVVGIMVDSITLILDASASLVILAAALLMRFSINRVHRPPDDTYNFGYHKYEPLTAFVQNILIISTCVISIKFAIQDIVHAEAIHSYSLPVLATFFAGILGIFIMVYLKKIAQKTNSQMIKAASVHWFTDMILSFSLCVGFLLGFLVQFFGYTNITPYIDPIMAILLAILLILVPVKGGANSLFELLDAAPVKDIRDKVKKVVEQHIPESFGVKRLRARKAGQKIFIEICFLVKENLTISQVELLALDFEQDLKDEIPDSDIVIYFKSKKP